jgi:hypothetical protein
LSQPQSEICQNLTTWLTFLNQQLGSTTNKATARSYHVLIVGTKNDLAKTMSNLEKSNLIQKVCKQVGVLNVASVIITSSINGTKPIVLLCTTKLKNIL